MMIILKYRLNFIKKRKKLQTTQASFAHEVIEVNIARIHCSRKRFAGERSIVDSALAVFCGSTVLHPAAEFSRYPLDNGIIDTKP